MRTVPRHLASLGGAAVLVGVALGLALGVMVGDLRNAFIAIAALTAIALAALGVRALRRANKQIDQIFDDELD